MKILNTYSMLSFFLAGGFFSSMLTANAKDLQRGTEGFLDSSYIKNYGTGFEIQNKGGNIWVAVSDDRDNSIGDLLQINAEQTKSLQYIGSNTKAGIEEFLNKKLIVRIYNTKPTKSLGKWVDSNEKYEIDAIGKTKFITIGPKGFYPQTGPLLGILGKTKSGLLLDINLRKNQIRKLK